MSNPDEMIVSKFRFYSMGAVATNKANSSNVIEVTPIEDLNMLDGQVTSEKVVASSGGQKADGSHYATSLKTKNTLRASWLPFTDANRKTSPDVQVGERVILYQFGETDNYWWTTLMDDSRLRRLETVIYGFSATTSTSGELNHDNMYYFEVSTHRKLFALHTSQANGEPYGYDVQIDAGAGKIVFSDTVGNYFELVSAERKLKMQNTSGAYVELIDQVLNMKTGESINMETQSLTMKAQNVTTDASEVTTNSNTVVTNCSQETINGNLAVTQNFTVS